MLLLRYYGMARGITQWHKNPGHDVCQILKTPLDGDVFSRCPHSLTNVLEFLIITFNF